jgi:hypothetical protein
MASKKAASRKPKGYVDDIWKAMQAANKAGDKKRASELRDMYDSATKRSMSQASGKKEMLNQWGRIVTKSMKTDERAAQATSKAAREAELARGRGIKSRAEALGKAQEANPRKAKESGAARADARKRAKERGGVNSPSNVARRRNKRSGGGRSAR